MGLEDAFEALEGILQKTGVFTDVLGRGIDFMGDAGGELADGLQLLCLPQLQFHQLTLFFGLLALADVACHHREIAWLTVARAVHENLLRDGGSPAGSAQVFAFAHPYAGAIPPRFGEAGLATDTEFGHPQARDFFFGAHTQHFSACGIEIEQLAGRQVFDGEAVPVRSRPAPVRRLR